MKLFIIAVILFSGAALGHKDLLIQEDDVELYRQLTQAGITPYVMEGNIEAIIKKICEFIRNGDPNKGVPPLDPLDQEHMDVNWDNSFLKMLGSLNKVYGVNASAIEITENKLTLIPMKLNLGLKWSPMWIQGLYDLDGTLLGLIPIYGDGAFEGGLRELSFRISILIKAQIDGLVIDGLDLDFNVQGIHVNATNFMGGELGQIVCEVINQNFEDYIERFKYAQLGNMTKMIITVGNNWLKDKTIQDIIDIISGKTTTKAPSTSTETYVSPSYN